MLQLATATADDFRPHLETDFTFDGSATLALADVSELRHSSPGRRVPFSLLFRGPAGLDQRTYRVTHARLGEFELFIVPLQPDASGPRYEAVFN